MNMDEKVSGKAAAPALCTECRDIVEFSVKGAEDTKIRNDGYKRSNGQALCHQPQHIHTRHSPTYPPTQPNPPTRQGQHHRKTLSSQHHRKTPTLSNDPLLLSVVMLEN
jgi:hypothetical protein